MAVTDLRAVETAEDFFDALDVSCERRVIDVYRVQVLRRFGLLREPDRERLARYREALSRAHAAFAGEVAPKERVLGGSRGPSLVLLPTRRGAG